MGDQLAMLEAQIFSLESQLGIFTAALSVDQLANLELANRIQAVGLRIQALITNLTNLMSTIPAQPPQTL